MKKTIIRGLVGLLVLTVGNTVAQQTDQREIIPIEERNDAKYFLDTPDVKYNGDVKERFSKLVEREDLLKNEINDLSSRISEFPSEKQILSPVYSCFLAVIILERWE